MVRSRPLPLCPHAAAPIEHRLLGAQSDAFPRIDTRAPRTDPMSGTASPTPSDDMYVAGSNRLAEYGNGQWQGIVDDPTIGEIGPAPTSAPLGHRWPVWRCQCTRSGGA